jgi:hypothetical protein
MAARAARIIAFIGIVLALVASGCVTPSVPIPPPAPEDMSFGVDDAAGVATFEFDPNPSYAFAVVYIFNRSQGAGIITTAESNGRVAMTEPFPATTGNEIVVTFEVDTQLASTCVVLADGQGSSARECDL